ncbi:MAG: 3-phosphoglycerate dehydrogenase [Flavobacteriaceae bacterium]|nr:3-phosphoglycerate dehydrogenase [Flavobacteriaceae bacterium]|tara:strand:+ start:6236 stop:7186 length:951 start_codon:yes stop_codon:yes gene_type:complete
MNILANDGLSNAGIKELKKSGFNIMTTNVSQEHLIDFINKNSIDALLVRSATNVRKDLIDSCPKLKLIGRGGVGMDNIDVKYAKSKKIHVINTPNASSISVAELVFAHLYGGVRFLYDSNRNMPLEGEINFKALKKNYSKGIELRGKTLGIIGLGRIGKEVCKIALGIGMEVIACDNFQDKALIEIDFFNGKSTSFEIRTISKEEVLKKADFVSLHVPAQKKYVIDKDDMKLMKNGSVLINASRGGVINEKALLNFLDSGKFNFAALDTFENEPKPEIKLLMHPKVSLSPHIGAATIQAQERIGLELASQINKLLK